MSEPETSRWPGVLCLGNIVMDLLVYPVDEVTWGGTRWVQSISQSLGGNGANTSCAIGKLGVRARLWGGVGQDAFGDAALRRLEECHVDTRYIQRLPDPTATTVALVRSDGSRAFLHQPGASRSLFRDGLELTPSLVEGCSVLHIGNPFSILPLRVHLKEVLQQAQALGLKTSLDTAWDSLGEWMNLLGPCLPLVDLLFTNEDEARMLTASSDPQTVATTLHNYGASTIVLKRGAQGCMVFHGPSVWEVRGLAVQAVDTTGAGDCFAGGFLAALQRGLPMQEAARVANAVGALNVQSIGATTGLRDWEQTLALLDPQP
ncbi:MAG: carbohydrate kinase family protein [Bryobacteraceae bacterium]|nr:carbohydrate kinase family protein [Bryobacteraceae bacterium]MDW8377725.1 carbohydrate kinase family protein [Bryobacterales bacterium]